MDNIDTTLRDKLYTVLKNTDGDGGVQDITNQDIILKYPEPLDNIKAGILEKDL